MMKNMKNNDEVRKALANVFATSLKENIELKDDLSTILHFIEQHKPPTFDDVVKAWEEFDDCLNLYIRGKEFCVTDIDVEETCLFWYDIETGNYDFNCESIEEMNAINLTIRYLESKKDKENE